MCVNGWMERMLLFLLLLDDWCACIALRWLTWLCAVYVYLINSRHDNCFRSTINTKLRQQWLNPNHVFICIGKRLRVCLDAALSQFCLENLVPLICRRGIWLEPGKQLGPGRYFFPRQPKSTAWLQPVVAWAFITVETLEGPTTFIPQAASFNQTVTLAAAWPWQIQMCLQATSFFRQMIEGCNQTSPFIWVLW